MTLESIISELESLGSEDNVRGMARFGICSGNGAYGVPMPELRRLAREAGTDHGLALELWEQGSHEARTLAALIDDPRLVSRQQMEAWTLEFDNWAVCDNVCQNLFDRTSHARAAALEWSARDEEYVKRAGFAIMAALSRHDKAAPDSEFEPFLAAVERECADPRRMVKKAVNWALREIGKRNERLNALAIRTAHRIEERDLPHARWVAADALRELTSRRVQKRFQKKGAVRWSKR